MKEICKYTARVHEIYTNININIKRTTNGLMLLQTHNPMTLLRVKQDIQPIPFYSPKCDYKALAVAIALAGTIK
jgi:hypothetical protein